MVYKNTILSLASLLAFGTACSKAPSYSESVNRSTVGNANGEVGEDGNDHVHLPIDTNPGEGDQVAKKIDPPAPAPVTPPVTPPATPPATPPPAAKTEQQINMEMITAGKMFNTYTIPAGKNIGWGTTTTNRIKVKVAVDAAGALIVPATLPAVEQIAGDKNPALDAKFAGVTTLHSAMKVCNDSGGPIVLHSGGTAPFKHGIIGSPVASGSCVQYLVDRLNATDGGSYDHTAGNNVANYVYLQIEKIGPDGKVVP